MSEHLRLDGRVAIVTGAGRGLGRAHAVALAQRGARVVVNDFGGSVVGDAPSPGPAAEVVDEIRAMGAEAVADTTDVSDSSGGQTIVDTAFDAYGRIDIIVANAGILLPRKPFLETSFAGFEQTWRVHAGGTYGLLRAAWPHLIAQGYGRVITTTSCAGFYGEEGSPEYSSAKGAIAGLTRALALEGAKHGIKVNSVAPAAFTRMAAAGEFDDEAITTLRPLLRPELVSPTVVWLAHESCPCTGAFFETGAGRTSRIVTGEPAGRWWTEPTPEALSDAAADLVAADGDLQFHEGALAFMGWLMTQAAQRASSAADTSS
jgi:NAD(P)-dependent dehydrogenase (short-subunit alcohol dehydrogenase family)